MIVTSGSMQWQTPVEHPRRLRFTVSSHPFSLKIGVLTFYKWDPTWKMNWPAMGSPRVLGRVYAITYIPWRGELLDVEVQGGSVDILNVTPTSDNPSAYILASNMR